MPSARRGLFIRATNALTLPATWRASMIATLFADGSSSAARACRSVSTSPRATGTTDSSRASRAAVSATSAWLTLNENPAAERVSGLLRSAR